uniref:Uncharacterized protein n=1 Tax=Acrobeloides nanus TaxID=290746 RepID=A0A914CXV6_9BILA
MQGATFAQMVGQPQVHSTIDQNNAEFNQLLQSLLASSKQYEMCETNMDETESQQSDSHEQTEDNRESISQPSSNEDEEDMDEENDEESEHYDGENVASGSTANAITALASVLNGNSKNSNPDIYEELATIKSNILFLNHQISKILNSLKVDPCECEPCKFITKKNNNTNMDSNSEVKQLLSKILEASRNQNVPTKTESAPTTPMNTTSNVNFDALLNQIAQQSQGNLNMLSALNGIQALQNGLLKGRVPNPGGRKSKYCSPAEKKAVADYAQMHGASAAARKFNIPPPVAAYYHRKEYKQQPIPTNIQRVPPVVQPAALTINQSVPSSPIKFENKVLNGDTQHFPDGTTTNGHAAHHQQSVPTPTSATFNTAEMFHMDGMNPAHTGSPGFLRGRGRGRPKLIGDELDAELVEYMVQVKQSDPRGHLTASQALMIARDYIMKKAPGLLEEHGGQVKLKLTWAMKLVSRIAERQREIQLGLPAGTLSNMSKGTALAAGLAGGNLNAMTQNLLTEQMNNLLNQLNNTANTDASVVNSNNGHITTPQITNVRELKLDNLDNGNHEEITEQDINQAELLKTLLSNLKPEDFNENLMAFQENASE